MLREPSVKLESCWLLSMYACHYCIHPSGYLALLVIDVGNRPHSWLGLLVATLLWKLAWQHLVPWGLVLGEETFRLVSAWVLWALCLKCLVSSLFLPFVSFAFIWPACSFLQGQPDLRTSSRTDKTKKHCLKKKSVTIGSYLLALSLFYKYPAKTRSLENFQWLDISLENLILTVPSEI